MALPSSGNISLNDIYTEAVAGGYVGSRSLNAFLSWLGWGNLPPASNSIRDFLGVHLANWSSIGTDKFILDLKGICKMENLTDQYAVTSGSTLQMYSRSGGVWSTVGSAYSVTGFTFMKVRYLKPNHIVMCGYNTGFARWELRQYIWSSSWSQEGSSYLLTSESNSGDGVEIEVIESSFVTVVSSVTNTITTYEADTSGFIFDITGSLTTDSNPATAKMDDSHIVIMDNGGQVNTYEFSGGVYTLIGFEHDIGTGLSTSSIVMMTPTLLAVVDNDTDILRMLSWDGEEWSELGGSLTISSIFPAQACKVSSTEIAIIDQTSDYIKVYQWG